MESKPGIPSHRTLTNTAGEPEPEKRSRQFNGIEALAILAILLILLWPVAFGGDILGGMSWISDGVRYAIGLVFIFVLFVSPVLHGDHLETWGMGNPVTLFRSLCAGPLHRRIVLGSVVTILFVGLNSVIYLQWPHVAKFFNLHKLALESDPLRWHLSWPGRWAVLAAGCVISSVFVGCFIRYDNFLSAARSALKETQSQFTLEHAGFPFRI